MHPEKIDLSTATISEEKLAQLRDLLPEVFHEGKINFDELKNALGEYVEEDPANERFGLRWPGKSQLQQVINTPSVGTLVPQPDESVNWDGTGNIIIEGDNLEVLKLLQKSYAGKVKMIYIDPPYNTGNDFVYPDKYASGLDTYLEFTGQKDENGSKLASNSDTSGRYHANWLNMMYPRLYLARNLLRQDGVIFVSIDDSEVHNLRHAMDMIFGSDSFVVQIAHKARASVSNDKIVSSNHNSILLYARDIDWLEANRAQFGLAPDLGGFDQKDERGSYKLAPVDGPGGAAKGNPFYSFQGIEGYFRFSKERMQAMFDEGRIVKRRNSLYQKRYLDDFVNSRKTVTSWWDENLYTSSATTALRGMMGNAVFDNPKHVALITRMAVLASRDSGDIVLDFFAGSGTTGHAVMQQNAEDGINRKFILVQLPEPMESQTLNDGTELKTISDIARERVRRAGRKIKGELSQSHEGGGAFQAIPRGIPARMRCHRGSMTLSHSIPASVPTNSRPATSSHGMEHLPIAA